MTFVRNLAIIAAAILCLYGLELAGVTTDKLLWILLLWVLPVFIGYRLHLSKDRDSPIPLTMLLSWVGVLFALALPPAGRRCVACDETIRVNAHVCRFCGAPQTTTARPAR